MRGRGPTCSDLMVGGDEAWRAFWEHAASDLLGYCRKQLPGVDPDAITEVRDEAVSRVFEAVVAGRLLEDDPRRFAFGVVKKLCLKRYSQRTKSGEAIPSTVAAASAFRPSRIASNEEERKIMRNAVGDLLQRLRAEVLAEAQRAFRPGVPTAPLLQWAALDLELAAREGAPSLAELLGYEKSRVSRLRKATLERLSSSAELSRFPSADSVEVLAWDGTRELWSSRLFGCPGFFPADLQVHELHQEDLGSLRRIHSTAVDCAVCSVRPDADGEAAELGRRFGEAAARRSRI